MIRAPLRRCFAAVALALPVAVPAVADALPSVRAAACGPAISLEVPIARASARFAIPETLIRSVIAAESNFMVRAVSPKGAMGLMQLMPGTWSELRLRYALGADPFEPCDNIMAGSAYLRELLDRYGDPGFLAAYNAGPGRYEAYLRGARNLPVETLAYVARLSSATLGVASTRSLAPADPDAWTRAGLFAAAGGAASRSTYQKRSAAQIETTENAATPSSRSRAVTIFVARSGLPQ